MKKLFAPFLLLSAIVLGCQKNNNTEITITNSQSSVIAKPVAVFKINNTIDAGWVLEGSILEFDNKSTNADSYYWDFGNGVYSTDEIPANISFAPCGRTYTVTLTVKNKSGETNTYSQTYNVQCNGKHAPAGG